MDINNKKIAEITRVLRNNITFKEAIIKMLEHEIQSYHKEIQLLQEQIEYSTTETTQEQQERL